MITDNYGDNYSDALVLVARALSLTSVEYYIEEHVLVGNIFGGKC